MIVFADGRSFVPRDATGLTTADGARFYNVEHVFVRDIYLKNRKVVRVYLGEGHALIPQGASRFMTADGKRLIVVETRPPRMVYESPRSYFYINLVS